MVERIPPHSTEAERHVLAACLIEPDAVDEVRIQIPSSAAFYRLGHQHLWACLLDFNARGQDVSEASVREWLKANSSRMDDFDAVLEYARDLPNAYGLAREVQIVRDYAIKRAVVVRANGLIDYAFDVAASGDDAIARFTQSANELGENVSGKHDADSPTVINEALHELESGGRKGMTTGYEGLDRFSGGFAPGGLYIVAARPGQGKSALIGNMVERYQRLGIDVGLFPLEMTRLQMIQRMCAIRANVDSLHLREGRLNDEERQRAVEAYHGLKTGIWYNDRPKQNVADIAAQARVWHRKHGVSVVFIDYLQIMGVIDRRLDRRLQIAEMTQGLKNLARELGIVVIAACQINREVEKRGGNKKPTLADLKESGSIEEDADGVIGIYREEEPSPQAPTWDSQVGWMKNRHGGVGHVTLRYVRHNTRFLEVGA